MSNPVNFKVGDKAPDGNEIEMIYGETDTVLVYRNGNTIYHFIDVEEISPKVSAALREYERIRGIVFHVYSKKDFSNVQDALGLCLFNALTASTEAEAIGAFASLKERAIKKSANVARVQYACAAIGLTLVLGLLTYLFYAQDGGGELRNFGACPLFAAFGAFASVILRLQGIAVDPFESTALVLFQGAFRILVGVLFAIFLVAAAEANLLAGIATTNTATLLAYSFISGFSERFAPEIISRLNKVKDVSKDT